jgi:alpha-L-fucosidase 2
MKKWILTSIISSSIVLVATANEPEKKAEYLAGKKKNIESRGNKYDEKQWSDHFDAQDLNKDGALSAEEKTAYKASQKASKNTAKKAPKKAPKKESKQGTPKLTTTVVTPLATAKLPAIDPINTLWFQQPANSFTQSLVIGNGRLGAMVYGDPNQEQIVLNDKSLWSGSNIEHNIHGGFKDLPQIRKHLAAEEFDEAKKLMRGAFKVNHGPAYGTGISPFGRYQTLGKLHLSFADTKEPITDYHRQLDLSTGLGTVSYKRGEQAFTRQHFVSAPDQVFVTRLTGTQKFTISMDRPERFKTEAVNDNELVISGHLNDGFEKDGMHYVGRLRVIAPKGSVKAEGNTLKVDTTEDVILLFAAATDYQGIAGRATADPLAATTADLEKVSNKSFDQLLSAQQADHQQYYKRVSIKLPTTENSACATDVRLKKYAEGNEDPALAALFFNMGRYLIISSSRPGELPANLQGVWAEEVHTMWNGDYHFNINTQMNYWLTMPCNLIEMNEPMINFIDSLVEPGTKTAEAYYNTRGWIAHRLTNVWGYTSPAGMDIGGAAWLCEHLWEQYAFTMDKDFLKKVYPIMKSSCEFYIDNLYEEPGNKWLVTGPSASPETGFLLPDGKGQSGICAGPTIDLQQLRELFGNTIKATKILGLDEDLREQLVEMRPRIAPNQIDPEGRLQEWLKPYETREPGHRHISPLYGLYPYYEITPEETPEMAKAAQALLEQRGLAQSTGWSNAWKINLWARLGNAEQSATFVRHMLQDNTFSNLLSQFRPAREGGKKNLFQIEANLGYTSGIVEMLLQSHPTGGDLDAKPLIRILPALPKNWPSGKVTGLRARGGVELNIEWKDGELVDCELRADHDIPLLKVRYDGTTMDLSLKAGKPTKVFASKDAE